MRMVAERQGLGKAMVWSLAAMLAILFLCCHNAAAAPIQLEVTGEYAMGDFDDQESSVSYALYDAEQKAIAQAASYVEKYNQEHGLGLDEMSVEIAASRLIHEQKHDAHWEKSGAKDFRVTVTATYALNTDQLAEYVKTADPKWREMYTEISGVEREEARFREALRKATPSEREKLMHSLHQNGRVVRAIRYANEGLKSDDPQKGIACYTKAVDAWPDFFVGYCFRGELYRDLGKYDLAMEDFNRAIQKNPAFVQAYLHRGDTYSRQNKYDSAIADYTKALELIQSDKNTGDSERQLAYAKRSIAYREKGDIPGAVADANRVIALDSRNSGLGYYLRGMAFASVGDAELAMDDYEKASQAGFEADGLHLLHALIIKALQKA